MVLAVLLKQAHMEFNTLLQLATVDFKGVLEQTVYLLSFITLIFLPIKTIKIKLLTELLFESASLHSSSVLLG